MTFPSVPLPSVTAVIPTRARPELVRAAVQSVLAQDYQGPLDCVVVHDQEVPDHALAALGSADRPVTVLTNTGTPGLAGSRNTGLSLARGELIASCDDDDYWSPEKLRLQVDRLRDNPDMLVVGSGIRLQMPGDRVVVWLGPADEVRQGDLLRGRRKELHSSSLLMRREAFDLAGRYDEGLPGGYAEDYEWLLRVSRHGRLGVVREPLATIRKDGPSWFRERGELISAALEHLLREHPELTTTRRGHARILGQIGFAKAVSGSRREGFRYAVRALASWPFAPQAGLTLVQLGSGADPRLLLRYARLVGRGLA